MGLIFSEHLDYQLMAKMVAQSATRALGLLIAKSKVTGGMPYDVFTQLYNSLVQPVIDYGAAVWGTREYTCVKSVQYKACRYFLGTGKYTPNTAVEGEMAWTFPQQKIDICVTRLWCRLMNMDQQRINKRIFMWSNEQNVKNWNWRVKQMFSKMQVSHLTNPDHTENPKAVIEYMSDVLGEFYEQKWWAALHREEAIRGQGRNKLRTYRKFKDNFIVEPYVKNTMPKKYRSAFAKFRCGVAPLRLETGRYEGLKEEERQCILCENNDIESELHVIMCCPVYANIRAPLLEQAADIRTYKLYRIECYRQICVFIFIARIKFSNCQNLPQCINGKTEVNVWKVTILIIIYEVFLILLHNMF